jgi:predicted unusual protein kinase regulating ubiquinone biosynthesis (AarF/ABC1/UbiB family)
MNTRVERLIAALPEDLGAEETTDGALADLLARLSRRPVPTGRIHRAWSLGTLPAKIAAAYFAAWLRGRFAGREERERLRNEASLDAALRLLGGMGYLRGMVTKMGQALASWPDVLPGPFADALGSLHFQAPPMHYSLLSEFLFDELGGDPREVFAEFDTEPFAAASLGQVHRARLRAGPEVAVKVQYPGIARAIDADMRNFRALLAPMRFRSDFAGIQELMEDVRRTLVRETDYRREREYGEHARRILADDDRFVVPRVFEEHSTRRVLTAELLPRVHLDAWLARRPSREERDRYAGLVFRATDRLMLSGRLTWADPSPGNFLFLPDGRLGLIDFGCCRRFDDEEWAFLLQALRAVRGGEEERLRAFRMGRMIPEDEPRDSPLAVLLGEVADWLWEPLLTEGGFEVDEAYMRRGIELLAESARRGSATYLPVNIWTNRLFYGARAFLYRLGGRADYRRIHEEEVARAGLGR